MSEFNRQEGVIEPNALKNLVKNKLVRDKNKENSYNHFEAKK